MTYTTHRDTQEVLQNLEKLDLDDEAMKDEVRMKIKENKILYFYLSLNIVIS